MKYRKKPVVIEAIQFNGFYEINGQVELSERPEWLVSEFSKGILFFDKPNTLTIKTLEGDHIASVGDYIIKGVNGELYPCKPDIFEKTYEPLEGREIKPSVPGGGLVFEPVYNAD
jgi:hypothetical protein